MVFNADSPAYRSCCCHARTCTIVIGVLELIGLISQLIKFCIGYAQGQNGSGWMSGPGSIGISVTAFVIGFIVVILLFVGIRKESHTLLIPHLVYQVLGMVGMVVGIIFLAIGAGMISSISADAASSADQAAAERAAAFETVGMVGMIAMIVVLLIAIAFEIWFFVVVLKCYRFFRDQRAAGLVHGDQPIGYYKT